MARIVVRRPFAALAVLEAAHEAGGSLQEWGDRVAQAASELYGNTAALSVVERGSEFYREVLRANLPQADFPPSFDPIFRQAGLEVTDRAYLSHERVRSIADIADTAAQEDPMKEFWNLYSEATGIRDGIGITGWVGRTGFAVFTWLDSRVVLTPRERTLLVQLSLHLEQSLRLRLSPKEEIAVVRPNGKILHAGEGAQDRNTSVRISDYVRRVEATRGRRARKEEGAVDAWTALLSGRYGLSLREERGGAREYVLLKTPADAIPWVALSEVEARVVELAVGSLTSKMVAYALGISPSTVSRALHAATVKLGFPSPTEMLAAVSRVLRPGTHAAWNAPPSAAEREVLALIQGGYSNAEIAAQRRTSERTVANQVASLLKKAQVPSRRALAATAEKSRDI